MICVERIKQDIEAIARFTHTPGNGASRPTFSPMWGEARDYVIAEARHAGCNVRIDAAGNVHARPAALDWQAPAWLCGSHIDSVPNGGDYDGVAGVVVGLELLRSANDDGRKTLPVELIIFAEEEGPTFGLGMLGSRAWVGEIDAAKLASVRNASGQTYLEAGKPFGVTASKLESDQINPSHYLGLLEVHIEQGPGMWKRDQRLAIVRAIAGRSQYFITLHGEANHAGATSMTDRRDALVGAAEIIAALDRETRPISPDLVLTVGRLINHPNAINVIADRVEFTIDLRAAQREHVQAGDELIRKMIETVGERRGLRAEIRTTESIVPCPMNSSLCARLAKLAGDVPTVVSGALHDSAIIAPHIPTAMLFVPSRGGISHNPAEFSRHEDIVAAAILVEKIVRQTSIARLNDLTQEQFVDIAGPIFEKSPWIAEAAWARKPFLSTADVHAKMIAIVRESSAEQQLDLVNAHPDLVGRLARAGRLTHESTTEQAAAGLSSLTIDEVASFEKYNAQYRERFGFPFVICARQNRKDAILAAFPKRLNNTRAAELATALEEIGKIAQLRLADTIWED